MSYRAFVSSTYEDLKEHRKQAITALRKAGVDVAAMEDWTAASDEPKNFCLERLENCDLCVLLVGFRRGYIPDRETQSITQLEYEAVIKRRMDILVFLLDDNAEWNEKFDERDRDKKPGIREWREHLSKRWTVSFFGNDPEGIALEIVQAWSRWLQSKAPKGFPFQAPPLPSFYISRPKQLQELKACLLKEEVASGTLVMSAIQGLGGIGKSVLAAAIAWDAEVQTFFRDGILWATLGQQPDILSLLSDWIQALGDRDFKPTTPEAASMQLRTLLRDKQALLVVDDLWQPEHFEPFKIAGKTCRLLVTTRRADVAEEAGAELYSLDFMTEEQSLDLLANRLARPLRGRERDEAKSIVKVVGYLPKALELLAVRVAKGVSWTDLQSALVSEIARLEVLDPPRYRKKKEASLEALFNLSLHALKEDDGEVWQSFIGLGVLPEDAAISAPMAATLWDCDRAEASDRLEWLWSEALLIAGSEIRVDDRLWPTYRLHDLVHDVARRFLVAHPPKGLGVSLKEAHGDLLTRYKGICPTGEWHRIAPDGYVHRWLSWHMELGGWHNSLHELLAETTPEGRNGWYEACDRQGRPSFFVRDVARAWEIADKTIESDPSTAIVLQIRYAAIVTSLNSMASNIPPELIAALVDKKYWSPAQGLAYVLHIREDWQKCKAIELLSEHLTLELLTESLDATLSIESEVFRANALSKLTKYLPQQLMGKVLEAAYSLNDKHLRTLVLTELAKRQPEFRIEALETARSIQEKKLRLSALIKLEALTTNKLMEEILDLTHSIKDEHRKTYILDELSYMQPKLIEEALKSACKIKEERDRTEAILRLAPRLPKDLKNEMLFAIFSLINESYKIFALIKLSEYFPELKREALEAAHESKDQNTKVSALCSLSQTDKELIREAIEEARESRDQNTKASALCSLTQIDKELFEEALEAVRLLVRKDAKASLMSKLSQHRPDLMLEALDIVQSIRDESSRGFALYAIVPNLSDNFLDQALKVVFSFQEMDFVRPAFEKLIDHLHSKSLIEEALNLSLIINDRYELAIVLSHLSHKLPDLAKEALEVICSIKDDKSRGLILREYAQYQLEIISNSHEASRYLSNEYSLIFSTKAQVIEPKRPAEAMKVARTLQSELFRQLAIDNLIRKNIRVFLDFEVKDAINSLRDEYNRSVELVKIARIQPHYFSDVLKTIRSFQDDFNRALALIELSKQKPELIIEALNTARLLIKHRYQYTLVLNKLVYLQPNLIEEALEGARTLCDKYERSVVLAELVAHMPNMLEEALDAALSIEDPYERSLALNRLSFQKTELVGEALREIHALHDDGFKAHAIRELIPHITDVFVEEALEVIDSIQGEGWRTRPLRLLPYYLSSEFLEKALQITNSFQEERNKASVYKEFLPNLPQSLLEKYMNRYSMFISPFNQAVFTSGLIKNSSFKEDSTHQWSKTLKLGAFPYFRSMM